MDHELLQKVANELENEFRKQKPSFGIYDNGGEQYIRSNKEGFDLFLAELIRARSKFDWKEENLEIATIELDSEAEWKDPFSDIKIDLIVPELEPFEFENPIVEAKTVKQKLTKYSVLLINGITFSLIAIIFIYGIYYLFIME